MNTTTETKKITLATIKSFIKKNSETLFVKIESAFDGMVDGVEFDKNAQFKLATKTDSHVSCTLGVEGVWVVGGSRNYFKVYEDDKFLGYEIYNCCGSSLIAVKK